VGDAAELFDPESETELRVAMEKVVFLSEYAAKLVSRGLERINLFSWEKCANETLADYEKILGE
jgi:glycosyltransferase involved in cell wall biosynthesis